MKRFILLALASMLVLSVGGFAVPAGATHPGVSHSNMDLLFSSPNATGATNSDLAFWGKYAYAGNYNGFRIFDISTTPPTLVSTFPCDGPQNDVSVWDRDGNGLADILFMSVDAVMEGPACGSARHNPPTGGPPYHPGDWEGIRIIDVSNPAAPFQIGNIYQDCGSHTHTLVPDPDDNRVLLYNASYPLRLGPTCGPGQAADPLLSRIQVSEVSWNPGAPLNNAMLVSGEIAEPPISYPGDSDNQFTPADHGAPAFNPIRACHDIAVHMGAGLVGAACAEQAQLWSLDPDTLLPDTANPLWVFDNTEDTDGPGGGDAAADFWHSATFTWDGKTVNFSDESFGEGCPPETNITDPDASVQGPSDTGRTYFLDVSSGKLHSDFMIPRPDASAGSYCSTHQGNTVPMAGRDYLIQAWYTGGVDVIDFTSKKHPKEVAFFDFNGAGPSGSDNWAHYWYETGSPKANTPFTTYGTDGVHTPASGRGFEQFLVTLKSSKRYGMDHLNPQTQEATLP